MSQLKETRCSKGISLRELGRKTGISFQSIWQIEENRVVAWPGWRRRLAQALECSEEDLFPEVKCNNE